MSLKSYKPYTKSTRTTILVDRKNIWKGSPIKYLTKGKVSSGGRNNLGRITSRSKGSGHKKRYRIIDFFRNKIDVKGNAAWVFLNRLCANQMDRLPGKAIYT